MTSSEWPPGQQNSKREKRPKQSKLSVIGLRNDPLLPIYPIDLHDAGEKLYRDAKGLRGVGLGIQRIPLGMHEKIASGKQFLEETVGTLYHSIGYGVKTLGATWETYMFSQLKKKEGMKRVQNIRVHQERVESDIETKNKEQEEQDVHFDEAIKEQTEAINNQLTAVIPDVKPLNVDSWHSATDVIYDLHELLYELKLYRRNKTIIYEDVDSAEEVGRKEKLFSDLGALIQSVEDFYGFVQKERDVGVRRQKKLVALKKILETIKNNKHLPEVRVIKRERLLQERDQLLHELHKVMLSRAGLQRKIDGLGEDMHELFQGREPEQKRTMRELQAMKILIENCKDLRRRAEPFDNQIAVRKHIEKRKTIEGLERQPLFYDLERVCEAESIPQHVRREIYQFAIKQLGGSRLNVAITGINRSMKFAKERLRYKPLTSLMVKNIQEYAEEVLIEMKDHKP